MKHLKKKESQVNTYDMDWLDMLIDTKEIAIKLDVKLTLVCNDLNRTEYRVFER